jgi:hypothetical protein
MALLDAETFYGRHASQCGKGPGRCAGCAAMLQPAAEWAARLHWSAHLRPEGGPHSFDHHARVLPGGMGVALQVLPAIVLVNDCRWVAYCPDPGCTGAQAASRADRRFFCNGCLNREVGGHWRPAQWPDDDLLQLGERVHAERLAQGHLVPSGELRLCNWWPSDGAGNPGLLLADLLGQGRLRQFHLSPVQAMQAMGEASP